jgi:O-antigen ligase
MAHSRFDRFTLLTTIIAWATIVLMIVPGSLDYAGSATEGLEANPTTRALWLAILGFSLIVVLSKAGVTLRLLRQLNIFFLIFVGLSIASVTWSIDPSLALRRVVRLLTMFSVFLAIAVAAWNPRRFQQMVRPIITLMLLGSIVFGLAYPELAIQSETSSELLNAWHGLATQKNELGALASFGFILWFHAWLTREAKLFSVLVGLSSAGACLVLSRSSTSMMATVFTCLSLVLLVRTPGSLRRALPFLVTGLAVVLLIYSMAILRIIPGSDLILAPIPMITGKDLSFSGRADIWAGVVDHIQMRPFFGSGYGAYWAGPTPDSESYPLLFVLHGFYPYSAHNGYLDVLNDLGAIGLICLIGYLIVHLRQCLRLLSIDRPQGALYLALFLQQGILNLSESRWWNVQSLDFVLLSIAMTCLARSLVDSRSRLGSGARGPTAGLRAGPRVLRQGPVGTRAVVRPAR